MRISDWSSDVCSSDLTGGEKRVDAVVVVSAPAAIQRERVLARPGMSTAKFAAILAKQVPDAEKRAKADFIVDSSQGLDFARAQVAEIVAALQNRAGAAWAQRKTGAQRKAGAQRRG